MVHFLTYYDCHTFDLLTSCPKCGTYAGCESNVSLKQAALLYDDWRLFGVCSWCGGGDGLHLVAGVYYRVYGVYLPFPHLLIATNPIEVRRLVDEREYGNNTNTGFGLRLPGHPVIDVSNGKLMWSKACSTLIGVKLEGGYNSTVTTNLIKRVQGMIFIADYHGIELNRPHNI